MENENSVQTDLIKLTFESLLEDNFSSWKANQNQS